MLDAAFAGVGHDKATSEGFEVATGVGEGGGSGAEIAEHSAISSPDCHADTVGGVDFTEDVGEGPEVFVETELTGAEDVGCPETGGVV